MGESNDVRDRIPEKGIYKSESDHSKIIKFIYYGVAKPWKRVDRNRFTGAIFNDKKMEAYQDNLAAQAIAHKPETPFTNPVILNCKFYMPIPKSWPKWKKIKAEAGDFPHRIRPDISNLYKNVEDALNGMFWCDDKIIFCYGKNPGIWYSPVPRIEIYVEELKGRF